MKGKRVIRAKRAKGNNDFAEDLFPQTPDSGSDDVSDSDSADAFDDSDAGIQSIAESIRSIAIVGRPNVGKSSLFNAILKRRHAIVHFDSGVTRDRVSASGVYDDKRFNLIDTGGLGMYAGETHGLSFWDTMIAEQADAAIEAADVILFVVDTHAGLNPLDRGIADRLRTCGKKIFLVANKTDNAKEELLADDFHALGFETVYPLSCLHRTGIDALMDAATADFPTAAQSRGRVRPLRLAVLGRPNVGKSSLVNRFLGENRVIVSDVPGTTRDAIDIEFSLQCGDETVPAVLVDTAGLRKKSKIDEAVEQFSMIRAEEALKSCDIVLFVIEASVGAATSQDKTIARMIEESGKGCIIVCNKWDIRADRKSAPELLSDVQATLPKMPYAPIVFTSAKNGFHFSELYEAIAQVRAQMGVKAPTSMLNKVIQDAIARNLPPVVGMKPLKIYYGAMLGSAPPRFVLFVNDPKLCSDSYKSYLINYFRKSFGFIGFPVRLRLQARARRDLSEVVHHKGSGQKKDQPERRNTRRLRKPGGSRGKKH